MSTFQVRALAALDQKTKPPGSLGRLEEIAARLAGIQRSLTPSINHPRILVFAADHGIAEEGISAYPQSVTAQMVANFRDGGAAINVLTRHAGIALDVIDAGVGAPTANFLREKAMTEEACETAIQLGRDAMGKARSAEGPTLVGIGEMGIGNTTSAAALAAAIFNLDPADVVGRGTGIDDGTLAHKISVVRAALAKHQTSANTPMDWLCAVGGKEIAAMAGAIWEAAESSVPVVIDGFIATAAAAVAIAETPAAAGVCFFAHRSPERGHSLLLEKLYANPILDLEMRLGEGTGAALAIPIIVAAARILSEMATFESAGVNSSLGG